MSNENDAVLEAVENLRQAMLDRGDDPGTVEGQLHMVKPPETNIVGNYADLQRMGSIVQSGILPTPPLEADIETSNIEDAFVPVEGPVGDEVESDDVDAGNGETDTRTKADLQAELDERGIEYTSSATKADLQALLG